MRERRTNKLSDLWRDLLSQFLEKESDRQTIITITHVELMHESKKARCYISFSPPEKENVALGSARRRAGKARKFLATRTKMRFVPELEFELDLGEKNRQRIDELLKKK